MKNLKLEHTSGVVEVSKASDFDLSKENFYKYVKTKNYEKVGPGVYVSPDEFVDELQVLHKRCPNGVISHDDALYHHGLINREPMAHAITVYSGYNAARLRNSGYQVYYVNKNLLDLGKHTVTDQFGNEIPMYDLERTVVDLVRNRSKFEIQDFNMALKTYAGMPEKNLKRLSEYAKVFHVGNILRNYLTVLLETVTSADVIERFYENQRIIALEKTNIDVENRIEEIIDQLDIKGGPYIVCSCHNLRTKKVIPIKTPPEVQELLKNCHTREEAFDRFISLGVASEDMAAMKEFVDFETLPERLKDRNIVSIEFRKMFPKQGWNRASWIVKNRDENGNAYKLVYVVEDEHMAFSIGKDRRQIE